MEENGGKVKTLEENGGESVTLEENETEKAVGGLTAVRITELGGSNNSSFSSDMQSQPLFSIDPQTPT